MGADRSDHEPDVFGDPVGRGGEHGLDGVGHERQPGARQYSVSGLDDATTYKIALIPAANVTVDADGNVVFKDSAPDNSVADGAGSTNALITVVNGGQSNNDQTTVSPVNGTVSFTVDYNGATTEEVVPVVWLDAESTADNNLDLNSDNTPSEDFGIGGETDWVPAEATLGFTDSGLVSKVNTDTNAIAYDKDANGAADTSLYYDSNDSYSYSSGLGSTVTITMSEFESYISKVTR